MAVYVFRARDRTGNVLQDRTEGASVSEVAAVLRRQGLLVIEIREHNAARRLHRRPFGAPFGWPGRWPFGGVRSSDLVVFTRQLATMIGAGLPIVRALRALAGRSDEDRLRPVIGAVAAEVETGAALSTALARHEEFPRVYVEMVRAGEVGGMLDGVLSRLATQLEKDQELRRRAASAMAYPVTVLLLAALATVFMLVFVVPVFARMFADLGGELPLPTRVAMGLSGLLTGPAGLVAATVLAGAAVVLARWRRTEAGRRAWGRVAIRLPLGLGGLVRKISLARFARTLGALGAAGVPILRAIEVTARACGNPVVEDALSRCGHAVRAGTPIHHALEVEPVFPSMVVRMISAGEEAGELDTMLYRIADAYEAEVDAAVKALASIVEPVMILVVGAIVGGIVIAMYLPMFRVFELIGP